LRSNNKKFIIYLQYFIKKLEKSNNFSTFNLLLIIYFSSKHNLHKRIYHNFQHKTHVIKSINFFNQKILIIVGVNEHVAKIAITIKIFV